MAEADSGSTLAQSAQVSSQGYPCPPLSGPTGTSAYIYFTYTWINDGCPTPIRRGFYSATGFDWDHITYRRIVSGLINHETTPYARNLWAQALLRPGAVKSLSIQCHHYHYTTPLNVKRTMLVSHSSTNYEGQWGRKGIITAYWVSGHVNPCV